MNEFKIRTEESKCVRRIIDLHQAGYIYDFELLYPGQLRCIQESACFPLHQVVIRVVDQLFDQKSCRYRYIHSIDTCCGLKGIILTSQIITSLSVS